MMIYEFVMTTSTGATFSQRASCYRATNAISDQEVRPVNAVSAMGAPPQIRTARLT